MYCLSCLLLCRNSPDLVFRTASHLHQLAESGRHPSIKVPELLRQLAAKWEADHPVLREHVRNVKVEFEERLKMEAKSASKGMCVLWHTIMNCY